MQAKLPVLWGRNFSAPMFCSTAFLRMQVTYQHTCSPRNPKKCWYQVSFPPHSTTFSCLKFCVLKFEVYGMQQAKKKSNQLFLAMWEAAVKSPPCQKATMVGACSGVDAVEIPPGYMTIGSSECSTASLNLFCITCRCTLP